MEVAPATTGLGPYRPTTIELARGLMLGGDAAAAPLPEPDGAGPIAAFEEAVRGALERPPCVVAFSGGRDSAAVLAVAAAVARRNGLEAPVPVTIRFPAEAPGADESRWQEMVVASVGVDDWERVSVGPGELDWLGPVAAPVLQRNGLLYPASVFFYEPLVQRAHGGTLLTGYGGDELLHDWRWAGAAGSGRTARRAATRGLMRAYARTPARLRSWAYGVARSRAWPSRRPPLEWPWLRRPAARAAIAALRAEKAAEPSAWDARTVWQMRRRALNATRRSMALLAEHAGASLVHPFLAPSFAATLAAAGGRAGLGTRTDAMRGIFAAHLPGEVLARPGKAGFSGVFWSPRSRAFAESWDGRGVPLDLVDPEALRSYWSTRRPAYGSALLLQAAWLERAPSSLT